MAVLVGGVLGGLCSCVSAPKETQPVNDRRIWNSAGYDIQDIKTADKENPPKWTEKKGKEWEDDKTFHVFVYADSKEIKKSGERDLVNLKNQAETNALGDIARHIVVFYEGFAGDSGKASGNSEEEATIKIDFETEQKIKTLIPQIWGVKNPEYFDETWERPDGSTYHKHWAEWTISQKYIEEARKRVSELEQAKNDKTALKNAEITFETARFNVLYAEYDDLLLRVPDKFDSIQSEFYFKSDVYAHLNSIEKSLDDLPNFKNGDSQIAKELLASYGKLGGEIKGSKNKYSPKESFAEWEKNLKDEINTLRRALIERDKQLLQLVKDHDFNYKQMVNDHNLALQKKDELIHNQKEDLNKIAVDIAAIAADLRAQRENSLKESEDILAKIRNITITEAMRDYNSASRFRDSNGKNRKLWPLKQGDTLSQIANERYGSSLYFIFIYNVNQKRRNLNNPNVIPSHGHLVLPDLPPGTDLDSLLNPPGGQSVASL
ncbi:hypothetical protein FACS1894137_02280 [Spirochaetia bacterium]|nr:hypothetical protein FACS1894137_02280 [Spirochaetia bacterium]